MRFVGCQFVSNSVGQSLQPVAAHPKGVAFHVETQVSLQLESCQFRGNVAPSGSAVLAVFKADQFSLTHCRFEQNSGAITLLFQQSSQSLNERIYFIQGCTFLDSTTNFIYIRDSLIHLQDTTAYYADSVSATLVLLRDSASVILTNSSFTSNGFVSHHSLFLTTILFIFFFPLLSFYFKFLSFFFFFSFFCFKDIPNKSLTRFNGKSDSPAV